MLCSTREEICNHTYFTCYLLKILCLCSMIWDKMFKSHLFYMLSTEDSMYYVLRWKMELLREHYYMPSTEDSNHMLLKCLTKSLNTWTNKHLFQMKHHQCKCWHYMYGQYMFLYWTSQRFCTTGYYITITVHLFWTYLWFLQNSLQHKSRLDQNPWFYRSTLCEKKNPRKELNCYLNFYNEHQNFKIWQYISRLSNVSK